MAMLQRSDISGAIDAYNRYPKLVGWAQWHSMVPSHVWPSAPMHVSLTMSLGC